MFMTIKFLHNLPFAEVQQFEKIYPETLQADDETKQWIKDNGGEFIYIQDTDTGDLMGETYFVPLDALEHEEPMELQTEDGLDPFYGTNSAYIYATTILPPYQRRGVGKLLKAYTLGILREIGFSNVFGHTRQNGSWSLNRFFGAEEIGRFDNWFQTGEQVVFYKKVL
jgi:GNAT superfamily N-acetyltransferase